jgi:uncharacterized protein YutD
MQGELHSEGFDSTDWDSRFFNTLEWFSFLVNENTIKDTKIKSFFKEALIDWHDNLLQAKYKNDPAKYPEFKKLYKDLKKGS